MSKIITYEQIKENYSYDPETGHITRVKATRRTAAGSICTFMDRKGYLRTNFTHSDKTQTQLLAHRIAYMLMVGKWPEILIDHIDGDPSNNTWCNLRDATRAQNRANGLRAWNNAVGYKGVYKQGDAYRAEIVLGGERFWLGYHNTAKEAHEAYCTKAKELYGEYHFAG